MKSDNAFQLIISAGIIQIVDMQVVFYRFKPGFEFFVQIFRGVEGGGKILENFVETVVSEFFDLDVFMLFRNINDVTIPALCLPSVQGFVDHGEQFVVIPGVMRKTGKPRCAAH